MKYKKNCNIKYLKLRYKIKIKILKLKSSITKKDIQKHYSMISKVFGIVWKFIEVISVLASVIVIILFIQDGNMSKFLREQSLSKSISINEWMNILLDVKLYCNNGYIEDIFGAPIFFNTISFGDDIYYESIYTNDYFTLVCLYNQNSLTGYSVIGNDMDFKFRNYRAGFSLFDCTINSAENICKQNGVQSIISMGCFNGDRLDCSKYFYECNLQHSKGGSLSVLIGYGVTDVGYIKNTQKFNDDIRALPNYSGSYLNDREDNKINRVDYYFNTKDSAIREYPINFFFVFEDNCSNMELLQQRLINVSMILSKDKYANLQDDYIKSIDQYLE